MALRAEPRIVILGAGPAGIGAAYRLTEIGYRNWAIYERRAVVGGLARSITDGHGFTYDIGGHVISSHYAYFDRFVDRMLGEDHVTIARQAWIYLRNQWVPYPFQNNLRRLPTDLLIECLLDLMKARVAPPAETTNFDEFIRARFGNAIAECFLLPYNAKVWAHPPALLGTSWLGERVPVPAIEDVLRGIIEGTDDITFGPHYVFKFPLFGGTGGLFSPCEPLIRPHLTLNANAVRICPTAQSIQFADGTSTNYDVLLSTMPLTELVRAIDGAPAAVRLAADSLRFSSGFSVGIGVDRATETDRCWIYYPEPGVPFYRVTYLSHYSPHLAPPGTTLLLCELSESEFRPVANGTIVQDCVNGLIEVGLMSSDDRVIACHVEHEKYWYPIPSVERNSALAEIQPYLMQNQVFSRGRFGSWLYEIGNMDHSVMMGVEFVDHVLAGAPEATWRLQR